MTVSTSLSLILALAGAAGFHTAWATSQDHGMSMSAIPPGAMPMHGKKASPEPAADAAALRITGAERITVYVLPGGSGYGFTGPDNARHDTVAPSSFVLRKGVPVTLTVVNLDDMRHSITAPGLGVNIVIKPAVDRRNGATAPRITTYTFVPGKAGEFRWFCVFPCDMPQHWAMTASYDGPDRDGFMAGIIRVL